MPVAGVFRGVPHLARSGGRGYGRGERVPCRVPAGIGHGAAGRAHLDSDVG
ncbi:hypothetical protein [Saccharomonospora piscinae]|uniref:hypothetical protein n=1 Tax=Saccharomonospora piscinae TaxID=687388 RepID=UPI0015938221|nr:hypothetical protein [Saccharomonospora piscinae]